MKTKYRFLVFVLMLVMAFTAIVPMSAEAASVKISNKSVTIYSGDSVSLSMTGTGSKKVTWKTSNKKVATISSFSGKLVKVTGKAKGTATIQAMVGSKSYSCKVTVKSNTLKLSQSKLTLVRGNTYKLQATTTANSITWSTSNKNVAMLNKTNGKTVTVIARKEGTATITCKVNGKSVTCKVTVTKTAPPKVDPKDVIEWYFKEGNSVKCVNIVDGIPMTSREIRQSKIERTQEKEAPDELTNSWMGYIDAHYQYIWYEDGVYYGVGQEYPISLSFNGNTFQTGEDCGAIRVLNFVPGSSFQWSSSDPSVVELKAFPNDISGMQIHAKSAGTAVITCVVTFPGGEKKTLTSTVNVSDTIAQIITCGTYDMNHVMAMVKNAMTENGRYNWIPDVLGTKLPDNYGYTGCGQSIVRKASFRNVNEKCSYEKDVYGRTNKWYGKTEEYIAYSIERVLYTYGYAEYQGCNNEGIQVMTFDAN